MTISIDGPAQKPGDVLEICQCDKLTNREIMVGKTNDSLFRVIKEVTFEEYYNDSNDDFYHKRLIDHNGGYELYKANSIETNRKFYLAKLVTN